ncbi:hypothetical protein E2320_022309, partial [Naja naja]
SCAIRRFAYCSSSIPCNYSKFISLIFSKTCHGKLSFSDIGKACFHPTTIRLTGGPGVSKTLTLTKADFVPLLFSKYAVSFFALQMIANNSAATITDWLMPMDDHSISGDFWYVWGSRLVMVKDVAFSPAGGVTIFHSSSSGLPPSESGCPQHTIIESLVIAVTSGVLGGSGTTTGSDSRASPTPYLLTAITRNTYSLPFNSFVTFSFVTGTSVATEVHANLLWSILAPPSSKGGSHARTHLSMVTSDTDKGPCGGPGLSRTLTLKMCFAKPPGLDAVSIYAPPSRLVESLLPVILLPPSCSGFGQARLTEFLVISIILRLSGGDGASVALIGSGVSAGSPIPNSFSANTLKGISQWRVMLSLDMSRGFRFIGGPGVSKTFTFTKPVFLPAAFSRVIRYFPASYLLHSVTMRRVNESVFSILARALSGMSSLVHVISGVGRPLIGTNILMLPSVLKTMKWEKTRHSKFCMNDLRCNVASFPSFIGTSFFSFWPHFYHISNNWSTTIIEWLSPAKCNRRLCAINNLKIDGRTSIYPVIDFPPSYSGGFQTTVISSLLTLVISGGSGRPGLSYFVLAITGLVSVGGPVPILFSARTLNIYSFPSMRCDTCTESIITEEEYFCISQPPSSSGGSQLTLHLSVDISETLRFLTGPGLSKTFTVAYATKLPAGLVAVITIGLPPSLSGFVHTSSADSLVLSLSFGLIGGPGGEIGRVAFIGSETGDGLLRPTLFSAKTRNSYDILGYWFSSITWSVPGWEQYIHRLGTVHSQPMIGLPPSLRGGFQSRVIDDFVLSVYMNLSGAVGGPIQVVAQVQLVDHSQTCSWRIPGIYILALLQDHIHSESPSMHFGIFPLYDEAYNLTSAIIFGIIPVKETHFSVHHNRMQISYWPGN